MQGFFQIFLTADDADLHGFFRRDDRMRRKKGNPLPRTFPYLSPCPAYSLFAPFGWRGYRLYRKPRYWKLECKCQEPTQLILQQYWSPGWNVYVGYGSKPDTANNRPLSHVSVAHEPKSGLIQIEQVSRHSMILSLRPSDKTIMR